MSDDCVPIQDWIDAGCRGHFFGKSLGPFRGKNCQLNLWLRTIVGSLRDQNQDLIRLDEITRKVIPNLIADSSDPRLIDRWTAIKECVSSFIVPDGTPNLDRAIEAMKVLPKAVACDCKPAKTDIEGIDWLSRFPNSFGEDHWSGATWATFDILSALASHGRRKAQPHVLASQTTPILVADENVSSSGRDQGYVMSLTVELLAGPPGLVTPDWLSLALLPMPKDLLINRGPRTYPCFIDSVNRAIHAVLSGCSKHLRARWWIDSPGSDAILNTSGVVGDSAQTAAACATLAALEQYESDETPAISSDVPLLDQAAAVTAKLSFDLADVRRSTLEPVGLITEKRKEAKKCGITRVVVADKQDAKGLPVAATDHHSSLHRVATLGDAYEELLIRNSYVKNYQKFTQECWDRVWEIAETPADE